MSAFKFTNVVKSYPEFQLGPLNFDQEPGTVLAWRKMTRGPGYWTGPISSSARPRTRSSRPAASAGRPPYSDRNRTAAAWGESLAW